VSPSSPDAGARRKPDVDDALGALCRLATVKTGRLRHVLGNWESVLDGRRAACRRCGRVVFVRTEGNLGGAAGPALSEPCDRPTAEAPANSGRKSSIRTAGSTENPETDYTGNI
jgi:hypothetical protein